MKRLAGILILPFALVLLMGADNQEARYQSVGSKIMCSCGCSQMLLKCNHIGCPNSAQMLKELRAGVNQSNNDEDVLNWFRKTWGITAVVEPAMHGFELLAWVLPFAGLGLGFLMVLVVIRSWKLRPATVAAGDLNLGPELEIMRDKARRETEI